MSARRVILVFVKWPEPGRVKTRLAADIGDSRAASIYRCLAETVAALLPTVPADEIRVLFDPPERETEIRHWLEPLLSGPVEVDFQAQSPGDLGDRLKAAFQSVFAAGPSTAAAIGTDCIEIDASTFEQCWSALGTGNTDAVFGPARDGGYYLAGLNCIQPALFTGIPWSTDQTLAATRKNAESAGLRIALLEEKNDIDTLEDWERIRNSQ